jgi:NitT/TauT family transport system permease protein
VVAGFVLSAVIALPLGLLIGSFRSVQALLEPLTDLIRYMPAVAFIPLVMLWVGIDEGSKISIIFIGTFFQMVLMVAEDVRRVPAAQVEAAQTMGASRRELVEKVILPSAKPALLDTLRITMGWAWTYLVVAELVAASSGLGYISLKAMRGFQVDVIFLAIAIIGLLGLITDQLFRLLRLRIAAWAQ